MQEPEGCGSQVWGACSGPIGATLGQLCICLDALYTFEQLGGGLTNKEQVWGWLPSGTGNEMHGNPRQ